MRFLIFIALAGLLYWAWPLIFKVPAVIPADSPLTKLSDVEQKYYQQVFDYTMEAIKPGGSYDWKTDSSQGTITVSKTFQSKSSATCRIFSEQYIVGGVSGVGDGVSCKREGRPGWCRLKKTDAQTCAFEPPANIVEETFRNSEDFVTSGKDMLAKAKGWFR